MDLNYLFARQQIERSKAVSARSPEARKVHEELARRYEEQIEELTSPDYHFAAGRAQESDGELQVSSPVATSNSSLQGSATS